jgi:hypothetical protein
VPSWVATRLLEPGVPEDFLDGHYTALARTRLEDGRVSFGSAPWDATFLIDPGGLRVSVRNGSGALYPVNSSLDQFSESVRVVTEMCWPDWSRIDDLDHCESIADQIREHVLAIDDAVFSSALEGFWETFYFDVRSGVNLE